MQKPPKSLGREWLETQFLPIISRYHRQHITENLLRTVYEHIANQIVKTIIKTHSHGTILATGGGAKNKFLINLIKLKLDGKLEMIIPEEKLIDHKEALIFAFLGLLRLLNRDNCLASVTGARCDNIGGSIFRIK
jgi:anhydro-N-acetylmuramic acid kinase